MSFTTKDIFGLSAMDAPTQLNILKSILSSLKSYAVIALDPKGQIIAWNVGAQEMYGYESSEVIGKNIEVLFTKEEISSGKLALILSEARNQEKWTDTLKLVRKDGLPIQEMCTVTKREEGFTFISHATSDQIKELKSNETILQIKNKELSEIIQEFYESIKLKKEFVANISHEFRTPLTSILGYTEILLDGFSKIPAKEIQEFLKNILKSANQLLHFTDDLLDFAKIESGKMKFNFGPIDFKNIVDEIKNSFSIRSSQKNISLEIEIDKNLPTIISDPIRLKQILFNYISNAIKFTDKGFVRIKIKLENENAFRLEVEDSGIGIAEENLKKLFVRFQQLDLSSSKKYQGTGLGLALTKYIVEEQGGEVGVDSQLGKGSRFYAILPLIPHQDKKSSPQFEKLFSPQTYFSHEGKNGDKPVVLVVEQPSQKRDEMIVSLNRAGFDVTIAPNLNRLRYEPNQFDAMILNVARVEPLYRDLMQSLRVEGPMEAPKTLTLRVEMPIYSGLIIHDFLLKPLNINKFIQKLAELNLEPHEKKTILIIDNNQEVIKPLCASLRERGFDCIPKTSEARGLLAFIEERPHVVLIDAGSLGSNGFEFLHRLKNERFNIPLIIYSDKPLSLEDRERFQPMIQRIVLTGKSKEALMSKINHQLEMGLNKK